MTNIHRGKISDGNIMSRFFFRNSMSEVIAFFIPRSFNVTLREVPACFTCVASEAYFLAPKHNPLRPQYKVFDKASVELKQEL